MEINDKALVFETASFKAERGSVLHSGIYSRDLASSLAAGACILLAGFFFAGRIKLGAAYFVAILALFTVLFLAFRVFFFHDPVLRMVIDREKGHIDISTRNAIGARKVSFPMSELENVRQDYVSFSPENADGTKLVEHIAAQHGTVIPGFGKTLELYTLETELRDGRRFVVYSSKDPSAAGEIASQIKDWLNKGVYRGENAKEE